MPDRKRGAAAERRTLVGRYWSGLTAGIPDPRPRQLRDAQQSCRYPTREYQLDRPSLKMAPPRSLSGIRVLQLAHRAVGRANSSPLTTKAISASRGRLAADGRIRQPAFSRLQHEAEFERVALPRFHEIPDQRPGHAELAVGFQMRIAGIVDLGGDRLESGLVDQEAAVGRAEVVAPLRTQQHTGGAVHRHRIACGLDAPKAETAVRPGREFAAQVL